MRQWRLHNIAFHPKGNVVSFRDPGEQKTLRAVLSLTVSANGRLLRVGCDGKLYIRNQRTKRELKLSSAKAKACRDAACKAITWRALGREIRRFPLQELPL